MGDIQERTYEPVEGEAPQTALAKPNGGGKTIADLVVKRRISEAQWLTLRNSLYPGAKPESVIMVWDYCLARSLDPMKKPCHIVPMEVKDAKTGRYEWRDVIMPGVYELRTTAHRTGEYLGHSTPAFGIVTEYKGVEAPEWCEMTFYRQRGAGRAEFPVRVLFREVVGRKKDGSINSRWTQAPVQMLTKCCEAAGLREAFPEDIGGEHTVEEMEGRRIESGGTVDASELAQAATETRATELKERIGKRRARKAKGSASEPPAGQAQAEAAPGNTPPAAEEREQPGPATSPATPALPPATAEFRTTMVHLYRGNPKSFLTKLAEWGYSSVDDMVAKLPVEQYAGRLEAMRAWCQ